ncbi:MAG: type III pantothenate kinase [Deltaproteobacteria bacterium]|nr:type III pantothenate kinase [Deltaproteobacteria bacterium]
MLVAVDIGNTNIVVGVFKGEALERHWRISTDKKRTSDEYGVMLLNLFAASLLDKKEVNGAVICSVVPGLNKVFQDAFSDYFSIKAPVVGEDIKAGIPVLTDNPSEVGADRIVNAVAAYDTYKTALIIVDFGTAVTFDYVTPKGEYAGGVIAPGISISSEALYEKTAKLPMVEAARPDNVVGRNTVESMRSGIFWGFIGLVDGIIEKIKWEVKTEPRVIATGGLAPLVINESRYVTESDEFLTLKGLKIIYEGIR